MLSLLCDVCRRSISGDGFELTLMPGTLAPSHATPFHRFTSATAGVISATMCLPCGERITAILHQKLHDPCPTCEVAPARQAARRRQSRRAARDAA